MRITVERVYESTPRPGTFRVLVDRLWPRGLSKERAALDEWLKDAAPATELRKWFGHDPGRWDGFRERYFAELDGTAALDGLEERAGEREVVLLYSASERVYNNAMAVKEYLERKTAR